MPHHRREFRFNLEWFLICCVFGNMPYMLFSGLLGLRRKQEREKGEGFLVFLRRREKAANQYRLRQM